MASPRSPRPGRDRADLGSLSPQATPLQLSETDSSLWAALQYLTSRDDGWLRIVPHDCGDTVYYKWKFTAGRHLNSYVMWLDTNADPVRSLVGLIGKLKAVDEGLFRPIKDRPYNAERT
jgi:hypothetical protein